MFAGWRENHETESPVAFEFLNWPKADHVYKNCFVEREKNIISNDCDYEAEVSNWCDECVVEPMKRNLSILLFDGPEIVNPVGAFLVDSGACAQRISKSAAVLGYL